MGKREKIWEKDACLSCNLGQANTLRKWRRYFMCLKKWAWARLYFKIHSSNKFKASIKEKRSECLMSRWALCPVLSKGPCSEPAVPLRQPHRLPSRTGGLGCSPGITGPIEGPCVSFRDPWSPKIVYEVTETLTNSPRERIHRAHQISKWVHDVEDRHPRFC